MQNKLGEYLNTMRKRHPRLSMRQMAIEADVGESIVNGIIKRGQGARPETLRKLADAWGNEDDYRELMRLAGHPLPEVVAGDLVGLDADIIQALESVGDDFKQAVLKTIKTWLVLYEELKKE